MEQINSSCPPNLLVFQCTYSQSTILTPDVVSCPGVEVTFTCRTPQGSDVLTWRIILLRNGTELMNGPTDRLYVMNDQPGSMTVNHDGLLFHFTLVETNPAIVSTISMRTSLPLSMNATRIECVPNTLGSSYTPDNSSFLFFGMSLSLFYGIMREILMFTFAVPGTPQRLSTGDPTPHANGVNFTVSWDAGEVGDVNYRVAVVPALVSLQSVFVTQLTSLQLTFEYSTDYTIEVVASNCVGNSTPATLNINSGIMRNTVYITVSLTITVKLQVVHSCLLWEMLLSVVTLIETRVQR